MSTLHNSGVYVANSVCAVWNCVRSITENSVSYNVYDALRDVTHAAFVIPLTYEDLVEIEVMEFLGQPKT